MQHDHLLATSVIRFILKVIFSLFLCCLLSSCKQEPAEKQPGTLKVITRNGSTTYYEDKSGPTGFEYELAKLFADSQNLDLEISSAQSLDEIFDNLNNGSIDIAAAGLTITPERQEKWLFSPAYLHIKQQLIYNRKLQNKPQNIDDVIGKKLTVIANSSHVEILEQLKKDHPELKWHAAPDVETIDLLDMLNSGEIDYSIIDSNEFIANRGFYPQIRSALELGKESELAWALPKNADNQQRLAQLQVFFKTITADGTLQQLEERFYSHVKHIGIISTNTFAKSVTKKLPQYEKLIKEVAQQHNMDWRLLAAISYQESHWNPHAKSPTGVRGMMMLTRTTAKEMKITNRIDARQSLHGGAGYFKKIFKKMPKSIKEPDRTWFTLAAYNIGLAHIKDVRRLTKKLGGNPDKWADVKNHLPLLQKRRWYRQTRHGFARGQEAFTYVQNIRHFFNYLEWLDLSHNRRPPPKNMEQYLPETLLRDFDAL